jgi:predicted MPP superfamily phosphohydrolase
LIDTSIKKSAITGNWEYWGKIDLLQLRNVYQKHNCDFLINENRTYSVRNQQINIIGVDDFVGGNPSFEKSTKNLSAADKNIALIHCPEFTDKINTDNLDLILSGHTHGGQINLFGFVPFKPQGSGNYLKGWYKNSKMYVSKGIGTSILPVRFGARAEVVEIDL